MPLLSHSFDSSYIDFATPIFVPTPSYSSPTIQYTTPTSNSNYNLSIETEYPQLQAAPKRSTRNVVKLVWLKDFVHQATVVPFSLPSHLSFTLLHQSYPSLVSNMSLQYTLKQLVIAIESQQCSMSCKL